MVGVVCRIVNGVGRRSDIKTTLLKMKQKIFEAFVVNDGQIDYGRKL